MAQPASSPKIEELRFRVKTDPKSRLFYPLAEELRKIGRFEEAEQVLRSGLTYHAAYLSAWVGLGRILREQDKHREASEALSKALQIDPGNVVAARLLAQSYYDLGDKVEAIKKYKLVRALLPADEDLASVIEKLERELNPVKVSSVELSEPPMFERLATEETPFKIDESRAIVEADRSIVEEKRRELEAGDAEPMRAAHDASPFEDPAPAYTTATLDVERPPGVHVDTVPQSAGVPTPLPDEEAASNVFAPVETAGDLTATLTMADLYVQQGLPDQARQIYEKILQRDPDNREVRDKLSSLSRPSPSEPAAKRENPKVTRLEQWLAKVKREEGRV